MAISKPLSQLEIMHQMTGALIEQERKIKTLSGQIECVQTFLQDTCDIINLNPLKWREDCNRLVASIAKKRGGFQHIEEVWTEIYDAIDSRMNTNLSTRVENMKKRMEINGAGKAKIKAANKLDVIGQNSRLIEGTCHIVKQLAIKNGVGVS